MSPRTPDLSRLRGILVRLLPLVLRRALFRARPAAASPPGFSVERISNGGVRFAAAGEPVQVSQVLLDVLRILPGRVGLVVVEYREGPGYRREPTEWIGASLERHRVLQALMSLRDLLGRSGFDVAVFSPSQGIEVFLDSLGGLEIRAEAWNEPRLLSILDHAGFRPEPSLSLSPAGPREPTLWTIEARHRLRRVRRSLGLAAGSHPGAKEIV